MKKCFRTFHIIQALSAFFEQSLPLDVFLRLYCKKHAALGSHDRKYIAETIYRFVRWQGLIDFLSGHDSHLEKKIEIAEQLDPLAFVHDAKIPLEYRLSFPKKYLDLLLEQWPKEKVIDFCLSSNTPAPTTIRTNTLKISREDLFDRLKKHHNVSLGQFSPLAIHFHQKINFLILQEFKEGLFEVQDEASQLAALMVGIQPSEQLLDFCAGSGGKSLAIALQMHKKGQIYLHDVRCKALQEAKKRLYRAGIENAQLVLPEYLRKKNLLGKMDWVLVDVPCSGSGTLRRNPDMKWRFSLEELSSTIELQKHIFSEAFQFVKPGGHIVYATCSVFLKENAQQADYFLQKFPIIQTCPAFFSCPTIGGMDGFYSTVFQKT